MGFDGRSCGGVWPLPALLGGHRYLDLTSPPSNCHENPPLSEHMKPRVLVVDDERDVLELVEFKLSGEGFEVLRAATGLEGLSKARCESPNVIVLDMLLPDLDGVALCEILRAQPSTRDVPILVFSVLERPIATRAARISVFHWLKKGCHLDVLADCVRGAMKEHRARVELRLSAEEGKFPRVS
jgi:DNA-binding response OmpR family regulator